MDISEIPADEVVEMTELLRRTFKAAGCIPQCHACLKSLLIGDEFKLATYTRVKDISREVMLCDTCTPADIEPMAVARQPRLTPLPPRKHISERGRGKGCFRVDGKIVLDT